jgi:adenylate kinase family enzyme
VLGYRDPLPVAPQRILVAGVTGSGKSTLARLLSERLSMPYTEIDSLFHGPDWTPRPTFLEDVDRATSGNRWVAEWQYQVARPLLAGRADTLVWLDHRSSVAFGRVARRTFRRAHTHEVLWNGNVEPPLRTFFTQPDENILRWAIKSRASYRTLVPALESTHPGLQIVRLRTQREVDYWLESLSF